MPRLLTLAAILCILSPLAAGDVPLDAALQALKEKKYAQALEHMNRAIAKEPQSFRLYFIRSGIHETLGNLDKAYADVGKVVELDPKLPDGYQQRGLLAFKLGKIDDSIRDFDKYIELEPKAKISHWQRGISYYYAGKHDEGRRQFEGYQDFDSNDVENAVWRYMCMVKKEGKEKAQKDILKIGDDRRVPMRQVYDMFAGKLKPDEVMAAAVANNPTDSQKNSQLFYAHLYVGIWYELEGDLKKAFHHLNEAAENYRIGHYMWDVARVHRDLLKK